MGELLEDKLFAGKYLLKEKLGQGQFGEVWRVYHQHLNLEVALKVVNKSNSSQEEYGDQLGNGLEEATILGKLRGAKHPGVLAIYDAGIDEETGWNYLVEELIKGIPLSSYEFESTFDIAKFSLKLIDAIEYMQSKQIFHNDLKPANILVTEEGPVITDFGLSVDLSVTTEAHGGARLFVSPEVLGGNPHSKSDLWSYGVIMHYLFAKQNNKDFEEENPLHPFESELTSWDGLSEEQVLQQIEILEERIKKGERNFIDGLQSEITFLIHGCLIVDPENRLSAEFVKDQLEKYQQRPELYEKKLNRESRNCCIATLLFLGGAAWAGYELVKLF